MAVNTLQVPRPASPATAARRAIPPHRFVTAAAVIALLVALASLLLALRQPTLNLVFERGSTPTSPPTLVSDIDGFPLLEEVVMLEGANGSRLHLRSGDLAPEPDIPYTSYAAFNEFLARQGQLTQILRSGAVTLHGASGAKVKLHPTPYRSINRLPLLFWYQLLVGAGCWMCGACIWAFKWEDRAAWYMALSGLSVLVLIAAAAAYDTRVLSLPSATFRALSAINHWGAVMACATFVAVFWHYPKPLARLDIGPPVIAVFALIALLDTLQWLPHGHDMLYAALLVAGLAGSGVAVVQWIRSRNDPLNRGALQWFLMSWCVGFGLFLGLVTVPALLGFNSSNMQAYAFGTLLLIAFGLCLGIARYKLFDLGTWWFRVVLFLLSGVTFILLDVILTGLLNFHSEEATAISLGVMGWVYFPLRQWLHGLIYTRIGRARASDLPALLQAALSHETESVQRLVPNALERLYAPLQLQPLANQPAVVAVADNGLTLQVPGVGNMPGWEARWPDQGRRLFSRADIRTMGVVHGVLERIAAYQDAVRRGTEQERLRLTQDLHDDIGARLLTLLHRHPGAIERDVRDILARLRNTVHGLDAKARSLTDCLDAWRAEAVERCQAADTKLIWQQPDTPPQHVFDAVTQVDLSRILREAVSNGLAHARPTAVTVAIAIAENQLQVEVRNDGVADSAPRRPGLGLRNMRTRVQRLGGSVNVQLQAPTAQVRWQVPLPATIDYPATPRIRG